MPSEARKPHSRAEHDFEVVRRILNTGVPAGFSLALEALDSLEEQLEAWRETLEQIAGPTPTSHRKTVDQLTDAVKWRQGMARDALAG